MQENQAYLTEQLITYIGNKRALLDFIGSAVNRIMRQLGKNTITSFDVFSGSGIVARYFKQFSSLVIAGDLEPYSQVINHCYLSNKSDFDDATFREIFESIRTRLDTEPLKPGIISEYYAPDDDRNIQPGERVFYTTRNAHYLDTAHMYIADQPKEWQDFLLAPLLSEASVHANTAGVFKGFYKDSRTGLGTFGGHKADALPRIRGDIVLKEPVFSNFTCDSLVFTGDANHYCEQAPEVDIAYLDPPYNQHPYGSNYFMLNLLLSYQRPENISPVSGIPPNWNRSSYNKRKEAATAFESLVIKLKAKYLLISFNSEGFISKETMTTMLSKYGTLEIAETRYNTFRGSRNLADRNLHVSEYLFILKKN